MAKCKQGQTKQKFDSSQAKNPQMLTTCGKYKTKIHLYAN